METEGKKIIAEQRLKMKEQKQKEKDLLKPEVL